MITIEDLERTLDTQRPTVLFIDGRSGAGKTSLAERLAAQTNAQVLHLDDLYPGWQGLARGSASVARALDQGRFHPYDWHAGKVARHAFKLGDDPLIIEGCGSLTQNNLRAAEAWAEALTSQTDATTSQVSCTLVLGVWCEASEEVRKARAFARDLNFTVDRWNEWAAQENEHFATHLPWQLAQHTVEIE